MSCVLANQPNKHSSLPVKWDISTTTKIAASQIIWDFKTWISHSQASSSYPLLLSFAPGTSSPSTYNLKPGLAVSSFRLVHAIHHPPSIIDQLAVADSTPIVIAIPRPEDNDQNKLLLTRGDEQSMSTRTVCVPCTTRMCIWNPRGVTSGVGWCIAR